MKSDWEMTTKMAGHSAVILEWASLQKWIWPRVVIDRRLLNLPQVTLLTLWNPAESEHVVLGASAEPQHVVLSAGIPLSVTHPHPLAEPELDSLINKGVTEDVILSF